MLPPSFLGVGPQGVDQKGMGQGHSSTIPNGALAGGVQDWGKCLAEETLSLKSSSHLEKPGCGLHRLLAVSYLKGEAGCPPAIACLPSQVEG